MANSINNNNENRNETSLFEPFRDLLSDLINQNKQLREEMNQLKKQSQVQLNEQSEKNKKFLFFCSLAVLMTLWVLSVEKDEELLFEIQQLKNQSQLQNQNFTEQLNEQSKKNKEFELQIEQLEKQSQQQRTEQLRKNEEFQVDINQHHEKSAKHTIDINKLQTDNQNQNIKVQKTDQRHNLSEMNDNTLRDKVKHLPKQQLFIPNISIHQRWKQDATTTAGGHGQGNRLNQISKPRGVFIDDDQTIYVADAGNDRIVEWKRNAINGQIVAGGNGGGNRNDQFNYPTKVIIDNENDSLIICDQGNRRVVRWPRRNGRSGEILISNIDCRDLIMDNDGYLYISDYKKHEVRRWKMGEMEGTIVAGGNGQGNRLDQLNTPSYICIDEDHSVYVSDYHNHRVMKWMKDAKEGIIVAGGQGLGNGLRQLSSPHGIIVDQLGSVYVADFTNYRVMRWLKEAQEGTIVVGGIGWAKQLNRFYGSTDLSFDRQNNLYVVDHDNNRVQRFDVNSNESG